MARAFEHVLVPLDGSPLAERVLPYAHAIATSDHSSLRLLRVVHPARDHHGAGTTTQPPAPRIEAEQYLGDVAKRLPLSQTEYAVVEGDATAAILGEITNQKIDLVAMSTHGRSGFGRWIYGSVADAVLRHSTVPVLLVSATTQPTKWPTDRAPRILVTLDYSPLSEAVLEPACALADALKAELILVSVAPLLTSADPFGGPYMIYDPNQECAERRTYLEGVAAGLRTKGYTVKIRDRFGLVDSEILDTAREDGADLIALATHGSGGVTRVLLGSVATSIVQRATLPLLIVRPAEVHAHASSPEKSTVGSH